LANGFNGFGIAAVVKIPKPSRTRPRSCRWAGFSFSDATTVTVAQECGGIATLRVPPRRCFPTKIRICYFFLDIQVPLAIDASHEEKRDSLRFMALGAAIG
jgi:hypothetical protein